MGFYICFLMFVVFVFVLFDFVLVVYWLCVFVWVYGFQCCGVVGIELGEDEVYFVDWFGKGLYGIMQWMVCYGMLCVCFVELLFGIVWVILVGMDYGYKDDVQVWDILYDGDCVYVVCYVLGCDYYKLMCNWLQKFVDVFVVEIGLFGYWVFVDLVLVLECVLVCNVGLGWIGKYICLIDCQGGLWFFFGEIYVDLLLLVDMFVIVYCGICMCCIDVCFIQVIIVLQCLDVWCCIFYLIIEYEGVIFELMCLLMGNCIYGCDDCQLVCFWNKFVWCIDEFDFCVCNDLDIVLLVQLFVWEEDEFLWCIEGSFICCSGYECWLCNIVVVFGNVFIYVDIFVVLYVCCVYLLVIVCEYVEWVLQQYVGCDVVG